MKNLKRILSLLFSLLFLFFVVYFIYIYFDNRETDSQKFEEEYSEVEPNNAFTYKTSEEIIEVLENGTGIVFFGFPKCPWCQAYAPMLDEVAKENDIKEIYYYNIYEDRKNNTLVYQQIVSLLKEQLDYDENGNKRIYVPDVTFVKEGKIIGHNNDTSMISGIEIDDYWTEDNKINLKEELNSYIKKLKLQACTSCND